MYVIAEVDNVSETEYLEYLNPIKTRRYEIGRASCRERV